MAKKQRNFYLSDETFELLEKYTEENGFSSNTNAIEYLIMHSQDKLKEKIAVAVREELDKKYMQKERLRWGLQTAEQNSIVILDAVNTLLYMFDPDINMQNMETLMPADTVPHPIIKQSRGIIKERIAHFKQKSDDRKRRKAEKISEK